MKLEFKNILHNSGKAVNEDKFFEQFLVEYMPVQKII